MATLFEQPTPVLRAILESEEERAPARTLLVREDGTEISVSEMMSDVRRFAAGLQALGVKQGDTVVVWLPNSLDCVRCWFAINYVGAVYVPLNTAYRGTLLDHVLVKSAAGLVITCSALVERLRTAAPSVARRIVVVDTDEDASADVLGRSALDVDRSPAPLERPILPSDLQSIIYTSGTTGPSKGVLSSYCHLYTMATWLTRDLAGNQILGSDDRHMVNLPLFHVGGTAWLYAALINGGSIALVESFNTGTFWESVNRTGATTTILLGVMATFLMSQPERAGEQNTCLRSAIIIPMTQEGVALGERFGIKVRTAFNMSEVSAPIISDYGTYVPGSCGRKRPGVELRIVDAFDNEVAQGEPGELIIRTEKPWQLNHGYVEDHKATAEAWRNGWFHTGDTFRVDLDGNYYFVDRLKDAIRRRGENISSYEVEIEVLQHPSVREAAAVGVPSEHGEDEILIAVSVAEGMAISPEDLIEFLRDRLAHYMIPRFVRIFEDLPKTPTNKVEKHVIRSAGVTEDTWDRANSGIVIKRERLVT